MEENGDNYVTREQFERLYPRGATVEACIFCGRLLVTPKHTMPDCGEHAIVNGEFA